jgi:hypothetical protein
VVYLEGCCGILMDTKARLWSLGMRQIPLLDGPLKASRRLSGGCLEAGRVSREAPARD